MIKRNQLEIVVGIFLIFFGCIFIYTTVNGLYSRFDNEVFHRDVYNYQTMMGTIFFSNTLIIMTGAYLLKSKK